MINTGIWRAVRTFMTEFPSADYDRHMLNRTSMDYYTPTDRSDMNGHYTAGGLVIDSSGKYVLMIHHRILDKWLFPGGHIDGGEDPMVAAFREVHEETGYVARPLLGYPIDVDSHPIPANPTKDEGAHIHHDLLFVGTCDMSVAPLVQEQEVLAVRWVPRHEVEMMNVRTRRVLDRLNEIYEFEVRMI